MFYVLTHKDVTNEHFRNCNKMKTFDTLINGVSSYVEKTLSISISTRTRVLLGMEI